MRALNKTIVFAWCLSVLVGLAIKPTTAQQYNVKTFTIEEGLPQSQVLALIQDSKGYIWFGTNGGGIARYDGKEFLNFTSKDGLTGNVVFGIEESKKGDLWLATNHGICVFKNRRAFEKIPLPDSLEHKPVNNIQLDENKNVWFSNSRGLFRYHIADSSLYFLDFLPRQITDIAFEEGSSIWVSTRGKGICKYKKNQKVTCLNKKNGFPANTSSTIYFDRGGKLWAQVHKKGLVYRQKDGHFILLTKSDGLKNTGIQFIYEDDKGGLWLGGWGGISRIDIPKLRVTPDSNNLRNVILHLSKKQGLSHNKVWSVTEDREGNIWVGTNKGLNKVFQTPFTTYTKKEGLIHNFIYAVYGDEKGNLWFGTERAASKYENKKFTNYNKEHQLSNNKILAIVEDEEHNIWFTTDRNGVARYNDRTFKFFNKKDGLVGRSVWSACKSDDGALWFGTYGAGVSRYKDGHFTNYTEEDGLCNNQVRVIWQDRAGNIWFGTNEGCLSKLTYENGKEKFETYDEDNGLPEARILSIEADDKYNMWLGTYAGVVRYDGNDFEIFDEDDGLSSNTVYLVYFNDDTKNLWVGTNKGVNKLDLSLFRQQGKVSFKHYGKEEGFLGLECNPDAVAKDHNGNIWFGTISGAIQYNPEEDEPNEVEPKTNITKIRVALRDTFLRDNSRLPYYKNQISFNFIGICLTNPNKVKYQYKLEGLDNKWSPVTKEKVAHYTNLAPGNYTFKVRSCNNEGVWNSKPTTFHFTITPPFWRTKEFYALCLVFLFSSIYGAHKLRVKNIERERKKLETKVDERTHELQEKNKELEKLSLVASRTDNGIVIADADGYIEWVNEGYTRLSGYTLEEFRRERGETLLEASAHPKIKQIIQEAIENNDSKRYEAINMTKEGEERWVDSTLTPIFDDKGNIRKLIIIDTDITERKKAEHIIKQKNKDITDSIRYAKRIQQAILPAKHKIKKTFRQSFIFYRPREIVSGDFYWFNRIGDECIVAAVDCTGHGVPGALMSMIGNDLLNQVIIQNNVKDPATILDMLNKGVHRALKTAAQEETQDGMDIALSRINIKTGEVVYAGALRPLYVMRANGQKFQEYKGDEWSIGGYTSDEKSFTNKELKLKKGDTMYLFSDGYPDQFGGKEGKKFMVKNFKKLLKQIADKDLYKQRQDLANTLEEWQGDHEQLDDILVIGVRY